MAVTEGAIAFFATRYYEATGKNPCRFVCPITLVDDPNAELCDGHILSEKLESASKKTVVQRKDVDNHLGSIIENDFIKVANLRNAAAEDVIGTVKKLNINKLTITSPSGERMPVFFAGDEARVRFQQISMYDTNGMTVAQPYLKSHILEPGQYKQLEVDWMFYIHKYCFTAAMVKSAYLNMFRLLGYQWVFDASGDKVRRTLAASFFAPSKTLALNQFSDFDGCSWVTGNNSGEIAIDSLQDNRLLFHFAEGDAEHGLLFGVSSLFSINGVMIAVTLPSYNKWGHYSVSWNYYQEFIRNHELCHDIHFARFIGGTVYINSTPLHFQKVDAIPTSNSCV